MCSSKTLIIKLFVLILLSLFMLTACGDTKIVESADNCTFNDCGYGYVNYYDNSQSFEVNLPGSRIAKFSIGAQCQLHLYDGSIKPFILKDTSGYSYDSPYINVSTLGVKMSEIDDSYISCMANDGKYYIAWVDEFSYGYYKPAYHIFTFNNNYHIGQQLNYINFNISSNNTILTGMQCSVKDEAGNEIIPRQQTLSIGLDASFSFSMMNSMMSPTNTVTSLHYGDRIIFECQATSGTTVSLKEYARDNIKAWFSY